MNCKPSHTSFLVVALLAGTIMTLGCESDDDSNQGTGGSGGSAGSMGGTETKGGSKATGGTTSTSATGGTSASSTATTVATPKKTILEIATSTPDFSVLAEAVTKAGLADALSGDNLTVFAPTNAAFTALLTAIGKSSLDDLTAEQLIPILTYHVVGAKVDSTAALEVANGAGKVTTLGGTARLAKSGDALVLDGKAKVTTADVLAKNGIIHVIDQVILPSITDVVTTSTQFASLETALTVADGDASKPNLVGAFDDDAAALTLFAPTDGAFGSVLTANGLADLPALVTALGGTSALIDLLKYHAASGRFYATDVVAKNGSTVPTLLTNASFTVTIVGGSVVLNSGVSSAFKGVNDAKVTTTDLYTSNGVVHVLDHVIAGAKP
ncbi:MAG: fasciclin domain-containing protein [Polyangiaceae bacterium]